ncbi:hypothetical protein GGU11DRAFT_751389 [Lentinula aff. detonsa]|nr:hypothetical protein GGU11DRAFT_751389 [Lentinula aff. detonsa]
MSTTANDNETIQQRRERILQAQATRQRAREEEIARQEAEFAAEMERIEAEEKTAREAEEKAAREAEEKRRAEEQRIEEEKRREEEKKIAEERRIAEEQKKKQEAAIAEAAAEAEDEQERATAFTKLVAENKVEKEKAARELEKRRKPTAKSSRVDVEIPVSTSSPRRRTFKSKAIISEDSSDEVVEQPREVIPRGTKRKRTIKMIAKGGDNDDPEGEKSDREVPPPPDLSQPRPPCSRCVIIGRPSECRPQSSRKHAQYATSNANDGKKVKLDDEVYEGPAARVGDRRIEGPGVVEQLVIIASQNKDLLEIARRSLVLQEKMLGIMARREKREIDAMGGSESEKEEKEDEDEDGEGEEDEEEVNEERRRREIREGKKRVE